MFSFNQMTAVVFSDILGFGLGFGGSGLGFGLEGCGLRLKGRGLGIDLAGREFDNCPNHDLDINPYRQKLSRWRS